MSKNIPLFQLYSKNSFNLHKSSKSIIPKINSTFSYMNKKQSLNTQKPSETLPHINELSSFMNEKNDNSFIYKDIFNRNKTKIQSLIHKTASTNVSGFITENKNIINNNNNNEKVLIKIKKINSIIKDDLYKKHNKISKYNDISFNKLQHNIKNNDYYKKNFFSKSRISKLFYENIIKKNENIFRKNVRKLTDIQKKINYKFFYQFKIWDEYKDELFKDDDDRLIFNNYTSFNNLNI